MMTYLSDYRRHVSDAMAKVDLGKVGTAVEWLRKARDAERNVYVCGNGGSASTASHFVADMGKGASYNRPTRFRIMALTDSLPTITAYANDVGYDCVFAEQLRNFARPEDIVIALSGSGNSPNVVSAVECGNQSGCRTIALTGRDGGKLGRLAQLNIQVGVQHMGLIEDCHLVICHMIAYWFMESKEEK